MNTRNQSLCAWSGPLYVLLFAAGMIIAGFFPPPPASWSAAQIAALYTDHPTRIMIGILFVMAAQGLYVAFAAAVTVQLRRIEGRHSVFAFTQLALAALTPLLAIFPMIFQAAAAFRPGEHSPDVIQALSDMTWMPFVGAWFTVVPQWLVTGIVILGDQRTRPVFPRWAGYANLWLAFMSIPSTGLFFFKTGPFSWTGVLSFWFAALAFFIWALVMTIVLLRAVREQATAGPDEEVSDLARQVAALLAKSPAV
jgi:hypothetical protein